MKKFRAPRPPVVSWISLFVGVAFISCAAEAADLSEGWWPQPAHWDLGERTVSAIEWNGGIVASRIRWVEYGPAPSWTGFWNGREWQPMQPGLNNPIRQLTEFRDGLYGISGTLRHWDGGRWKVVVGQPAGVGDIAVVDANRLLVRAADGLYLWDGSEWSPFGPRVSLWPGMTPWQDGFACVERIPRSEPWGETYYESRIVLVHPGSVEPLGSIVDVYALGSVCGELIAGYWNRMVRWDGQAWAPMGAPLERLPTDFQPPTDLFEIDGKPAVLCQEYAETLPHRDDYWGRYGFHGYIARWDGSSWVTDGVRFNYTVDEIRRQRSGLLAAGNFSLTECGPASGLAIDRGDGFRAVAEPDPAGANFDATVRALTTWNGRIVAGGSFITIGRKVVPFIGIGDGQEFELPGDGVDDAVSSLTVFNGDLIAGGIFTTAGGVPARGVARWDGTRWWPMGDGLDDWVQTLAVHDGQLYAGGLFHNSGNARVEYLARWDGTRWLQEARLDGAVDALVEWNGKLVAGGEFHHVNGTPGNSLATLEGNSWTPFPGFNGAVLALTVHEGRLVIAGQMRNYRGAPVSAIVEWDGESMLELKPAPWQISGSVLLTVCSTARGLVAGGHDGLYRWHGSNWETLDVGGNLWNGSTDKVLDPAGDHVVRALAALNGSLFVGGDFRELGGLTSQNLARWDGSLVPATVENVTIKRDNSEVRLAWTTEGLSNLRAFEVWAGKATPGVGTPPNGVLGVVATRAGNDYEFIDGVTRAQGARYWLRQIGPFNSESWSGPYELAPLPPQAHLEAAAPNPFRGTTNLGYSLARGSAVHIDLFDAQGRRVRTLVDGSQAAGIYSATWDGLTDVGIDAAAGAYWARFITNDGTETRKLLKLK